MTSNVPPAIFWIPHQDDDALGFAGAIAEHKEAGRPVYLVLVSNGTNSDLQAMMNGADQNGNPRHCAFYDGQSFIQTLSSLFPALHLENFLPAQHEEFHHFGLSAQDIIDARTLEFLASANSLGVDGVFFLDGGGIDDNRFYNDYAGAVNDVAEAIREMQIKFPAASHKFPSGFLDKQLDGHTNATHRGINEAAFQVAKQFGLVDMIFYRIYVYAGVAHNLGLHSASLQQAIEPSWLAQKQAALEEYMVYDPANGRYALGYHSVMDIIGGAMTTPVHYIDFQADIQAQTAPGQNYSP